MADTEKLKKQLLDLMSASKEYLDLRKFVAERSQEDLNAYAKLQREYVQSILLIKSLDSYSKIPALLRTKEGDILSFNESLSVGLDEQNG